MLYPAEIEQKLGFDTIKLWVAERCASPMGVEFAQKVRWLDNAQQIAKLTSQTAEFKLMMQAEGGLPALAVYDCRAKLAIAAIEGTCLELSDFQDLRATLKTLGQTLKYIKQLPEGHYPEAKKLAEGLEPEPEILAAIDGIIDEKGEVRSAASEELKRIRDRAKWAFADLSRSMEKLLKTAKSSGWISDSMSVSVRDGRMVLPIQAEHKKKIRGFMHDESASGQMAFIEPAEFLEANNEIKEMAAAEYREIIKILTSLTDTIRPNIERIKRGLFFLGICDFVQAKAKLAIEMDADKPLLSAKPKCKLIRARHPILLLNFKKHEKSVVPASVDLDENQRIVLVSGPNAGGKSVLLKTIGLLQYMLQSGFLIPASPDSEMGTFQNLLIDIGDEQSLENDLSTYSSHLANMKVFLEHARAKTLFLIDEFGTGTEPSLGGAIAEAILEKLVAAKAQGIINTHYTNLKVFADQNAGIVNGSMKFDMQQLSPLFELEVGKPGSSYAFEVAQKMGLPGDVVKAAKGKLSANQVDFEKINKELEIEKKVFSEKNKELIQRTAELKNTTEQYTAMRDFLDTQKKTILNEAKDKGKQIVTEANKAVEATIKHIKEAKAEKTETIAARVELEKFVKEKLVPEKIAEPPTWQTDTSSIEIGSYVRIKGQTGVAEVIALRPKDAEIAIGEIRTTVKLNRLEKVSKKDAKLEQKRIAPRLGGVDLNEKITNFSFNLDIRGKRGEEALGMVDGVLNDAIMLAYNEIRIVHGKGDGILRTLIRNHLKKSKFIGSISDEHADRGGAGVSLVRLK